jgi:tRNA A-37 threonylcarbamoyl transferase component Bud32
MSDNPSRPSAPPDKAVDSQSGEVTGDHVGSTGTNPFPGRPPAAADTDALPQFGGYRVVRKIGEGGMGAVFLAEDTRLNRKTAIKTMRPEVAAAPGNRERFEREAKAAAAVEHDNIVPILHIGEASDGTPFIVMPFLQGEMLDARLKREPVAPPDLILKVAAEVADGLAAAHATGLIHRDIKPGNVWLEGDLGSPAAAKRVRRCKILDFGLARSAGTDDAHITASGAILGTPAYMAPEQARGERVDHRADLFSLGVMLYRMATGRPPFRGPNAMAVLIALTTETPPPVRDVCPGLPPALADLIDRLMQKDAPARPQTAAEVAAAARQIARGLAPQVSSAGVPVVAVPVLGPVAAANPWEEATAADEDEYGDEDDEPVARPRAPDAPARRRLPWLLGGLAAGLLALAVLAAVVIRFQTAEGTLVVEVADPDAEIKFKDGQLVLFGPDGKEMYRLSPGERDKKLPAGPYTVRVEGPGGLKLSTAAFTLTRGDKVTVRVTFEAPKGDPKKPDPPKVIPPATGPADFRELHGATQAELDGWMQGLKTDGYIPAYLSAQAGADVRFNAVATPNPARIPWRYVPRDEWGSDAAFKTWKQNVDAGFGHVLCALHPGESSNETHVYIADGLPGGGLAGPRGATIANLRETRNGKFRPVRLAAGWHKDWGARYEYWCQPDGGRDWDAQLALTAAELPGYVADQRKKGWRLDWLSAYRDGDKLTFQAIAVENPDRTSWDFQTGLTAAAYEAELKARRAAGQRPLSAVGCADGGQTKYVVVWLRDEGFAPLFNGRTLDGWTTQAGGAGNWEVKDGAITCTGPRDYLYTKRDDFADFHLRADVKINAQGNSGIFFRATMPVTVPGDYEAQIALAGDRQRTGSLYNLAELTDNRVKADEWFRYEVIAQGNRVRLLLDGKEVVNYTDERPNRPTIGRIALQHFIPQTAVQFRKVEIKELKAGAPVPVTPPVDPDRRAAEWVMGVGGAVTVTGRSLDNSIERLPRGPFQVTSIVIQTVKVLDPNGFANCAGLTGVEVLWVMNVPLNDAGLAHFAGCTKLRKLNVFGTAVTDAGLAHFRDRRDLEVLSIGSTKATSAGLAHFNECDRLYFLDVGSIPVTDADFAALKAGPALTEARLWGTKVTDATLTRLATFPNLREVNVCNTKVTRAGVEALAKARPRCKILWDGGTVQPQLEADRAAAELILKTGGMVRVNAGDGRDLGRVDDLPAEPFWLTALDIQNKPFTDADAAALKGCLSLERVILGGTKLTDAGLAHLAGNRGLRLLSLGSTDVTAAGLAHFKDNPALSSLGLEQTKVTDTGLAHFKGCKRLTHLNLQGTATTAAGLAHFRDCTKLAFIDLDGTNVTDAGLAHLATCPALTDVRLARTKVTAAGVQALAKALPNCKIAWDGGEIGPAKAAALDPDRRAAEWVLSVGGGVAILGLERWVSAREQLPAGPFRVTVLSFKENTQATPDGFAACAGLTELTSLNLMRSPVGDAALAHFKGCTKLRKLNLFGTGVGDAGLAHLKDCRDLEVLIVGATKATAAGLAYFNDCERLVYLDAGGLPVGDTDVAALRALPGLTDVRLWGTRVTDATLKRLAECPDLRDVHVQQSGVTAAGVAALAKARPRCKIVWDGPPVQPKLEADRAAAERVLAAGGVVYVNAADAATRRAADLPAEPFWLTALDIQNKPFTDADAAALKRCSSLERVVFSGTKLTDAGLAHLADIRGLRVLWLGYNGVTDAGLAHFKDSPALYSLGLERTAVTAAGLAHFKGCKWLTHLNLLDTATTDEGLAHLRDCTRLVFVGLDGTKVTDAALAQLAACPDLADVRVPRTKVTAAGVQALAKARPNCKIVWDGGVVGPAKE